MGDRDDHRVARGEEYLLDNRQAQAGQRFTALAAMVSTLCAGGWLVVEEADPALQPLVCPDETGPAQQLANRLKDGFRQLMAQRAQTPGLENPSAQHSHEPGLASAGVPQAFADLGCAL
jgi:hypothetical protein